MSGREEGQLLPEEPLIEPEPYPMDTPDAEVGAQGITVESVAGDAEKKAGIPHAAELSAETQTQMSQEAQKTYGQLPEAKKGIFARMREAIPFRKKEDPVEGVRKAQDYLRAQIGVVKDAKGGLAKLEDDQRAAKAAVEATGKRAVEVSGAPEALQELLDDPNLEGVAKEKLQAALKDAEKRSKAEFKQLKTEQAKAAEQASKLEDKIKVAKRRIERFEKDREAAQDRLDDAVVRAINENSETGARYEASRDKAGEEIKSVGEAIGKLDTAISALEAKVKDAKEPIVADTLKSLLKDAQAERKGLERQQRDLEKQKAKFQERLDKVGNKNEQLVAHLSIKRLENLLDEPDHEWIVPMLSADQVSRLPEDRQRDILSGNEANQKALLPKLKEDQLQKLIDAGVVPDKDTLIEQGILKKPEAPKSKEAAAESAVPSHASGKEWTGLLADKLKGGGEFAGDVQISDMLADSDLDHGDIADLVYDKARARLEAQLGTELSPKQQEGLIAKVLKFLTKLLGLSEGQAGEIQGAMHPKEGRQRFSEVINSWNKAHKDTPGLQIDASKVSDDLKGKELAPISVKAYLLEQVRDQGGDISKAKSLIDEFLKPPATEEPQAMSAAA